MECTYWSQGDTRYKVFREVCKFLPCENYINSLNETSNNLDIFIRTTTCWPRSQLQGMVLADVLHVLRPLLYNFRSDLLAVQVCKIQTRGNTVPPG